MQPYNEEIFHKPVSSYVILQFEIIAQLQIKMFKFRVREARGTLVHILEV